MLARRTPSGTARSPNATTRDARNRYVTVGRPARRRGRSRCTAAPRHAGGHADRARKSSPVPCGNPANTSAAVAPASAGAPRSRARARRGNRERHEREDAQRLDRHDRVCARTKQNSRGVRGDPAAPQRGRDADVVAAMFVGIRIAFGERCRERDGLFDEERARVTTSSAAASAASAAPSPRRRASAGRSPAPPSRRSGPAPRRRRACGGRRAVRWPRRSAGRWPGREAGGSSRRRWHRRRNRSAPASASSGSCPAPRPGMGSGRCSDLDSSCRERTKPLVQGLGDGVEKFSRSPPGGLQALTRWDRAS